MARDLRELFKEEQKKEDFTMLEGHEKRFMARLEKELPKTRKRTWPLLKIAASVVILISVGAIYFLGRENTGELPVTVVDKGSDTPEKNGISLGDLSPDLKKIEHYYVVNIGLELSKLEVSEDNKVLVDSYMERLSELDREYGNLNGELNQIGPNDQTINALIKNLQLRLQLLQKLKEKLKEVQSSKNEQYDTNAI